MPNVSSCSSCHRAIIWAVTPSGARIPLDARPLVVYRLDADNPPNAIPLSLEVIKAPADLFGDATTEAPKVYVSHFVTCPNAAEHSKGGKR